MRIDRHNHILPRDNFVEDWIREMDRLGFDKTVFAGLPPYFEFGLNEWTHDAMKKHPDRIIGMAWFDLGVDEPEMVDRYAEQGYKGIKFTAPRLAYNDPRAFPVYERIEKLGLATLFHCGIVLANGKMRGKGVDSSYMRPICLDAPAREFTDLNFHIAHLGVPWQEEAMMVIRIHKNVSGDMTGLVWRDQKGIDWFRGQFWFDGVWDKLCFGTDVMGGVEDFEPQYLKQKYLIDALMIDEESKRKFFGGNAARLLGL